MNTRSAHPAAYAIGLTVGLINLLAAVFVVIITVLNPNSLSPDLQFFAGAVAIHFSPIRILTNWPVWFDVLLMFIMLINMIGGAVMRSNRFAGGAMVLVSALTLLIFCVVSITDPVFGPGIRMAATAYTVIIMILEALSLLAGILALTVRKPAPMGYSAAGGYYSGAGRPYSQQPYGYPQYSQPYQNPQQAPQQYQYQQPQQPSQQYQYQQPQYPQPQYPQPQYPQPAQTPMRFDPYTGQPLGGADTGSDPEPPAE